MNELSTMHSLRLKLYTMRTGTNIDDFNPAFPNDDDVS